MSTGADAAIPEPEGLQFDRAEFAEGEGPSAVTCSGCKRPIEDVYHEVNGSILCESCRGLVEQHFRSGSGLAGLIRAFVFGSAAMIAGAAIYFAMLHFFNLNVGLVSVLVGFMVGKAVRKGSRDRGGLAYQLMAVFLTYTAVGLALMGTEMAVMFQPPPAAAANKPPAAQFAPGPQAQAAPAAAPPAAADPAAKPEPGVLAAFAVFLVATTYILPFLTARENPINLAIFGFALWEAWKFTRRAHLTINGPYRVGDAETDPDGPESGGLAHA